MIRTFALFTATLSLSAAIPVWIDTDPSVARGGKEVDDGIALVQAFRSRELAIRGISAVFGNAPLSEAFPIAEELTARFGPKGMGVKKGAAAATELGQETPASAAIAAALRKEPLTLLVLGPATNIGTVLRTHPELAPRIQRIIAVAGRRPGQQFRATASAKPFRDLNFELDPQAFQVILDAKVPLVLTPWEISSKVWIDGADLSALRTKAPELGPLLDASADWLDFWKATFQAPGFNPFDALAVGYAINAKGFRCDRVGAGITDQPDDIQPEGKPKPYLLRRAPAKRDTTLYCHQAPPGFKADLLRRLSAKP